MTLTLDALTNTDIEAMRREIAELRQRIEQLEGESRANRQQIAFVRGRVNSAELAS